jgi:hypothetical protein
MRKPLLNFLQEQVQVQKEEVQRKKQTDCDVLHYLQQELK